MTFTARTFAIATLVALPAMVSAKPYNLPEECGGAISDFEAGSLASLPNACTSIAIAMGKSNLTGPNAYRYGPGRSGKSMDVSSFDVNAGDSVPSSGYGDGPISSPGYDGPPSVEEY